MVGRQHGVRNGVGNFLVNNCLIFICRDQNKVFVTIGTNPGVNKLRVYKLSTLKVS